MIRLAAVLLGLLVAGSAHAQFSPPPFLVTGGTSVTFTGVVDEESSTNHFWGLVAAGSTAAAGAVNAADLTNNSTTCIGVKVLSTGKLDVSSGLYCASGTQTVTTWCGGACTVAGSTFRVSQLYDQQNEGSNGLTQATYADMPRFILSCFNTQPCALFTSATFMTATVTAMASSFSYGMTFERTSSFTGFGQGFADNGSTQLYGEGTASTWTFENFSFGPTTNVTLTDGTGTTDFSHGHAVLFAQPAASGTASVYADGAATTGSSSGVSGTTNTTQCWGACTTGSSFAGFSTRRWTDPTLVSSTVGDNVTNLTTVPLP